METLKILVFDDNETHRKAAQDQLGGHDLTVVGTYSEAQALLVTKVDSNQVKQELESQFGDFNPYRSDDEEKKAEYFVAREAATGRATTHPNFDVVLTDLLVPASSSNQGPNGEPFVGQEMPLGTTIALLAMKAGVKMVGIITDANHHDHPASAALDALGGYGGEVFDIGDAKVLTASNLVLWPANPETGKKLTDEEQEAAGGYDGYRSWVTGVKDWATALERLIEE